MIRIITIPADENQPITVTTSKADLDALQAAVGGDIQAVGPEDITIYLDEEGKLKGRPLNPRATDLAHSIKAISARDAIVGDAVITGFDDETGENADAPLSVLEHLS